LFDSFKFKFSSSILLLSMFLNSMVSANSNRILVVSSCTCFRSMSRPKIELIAVAVQHKNSISSLRSAIYNGFNFTLVAISISSVSDPILSSIIVLSSMSLCLRNEFMFAHESMVVN